MFFKYLFLNYQLRKELSCEIKYKLYAVHLYKVHMVEVSFAIAEA